MKGKDGGSSSYLFPMTFGISLSCSSIFGLPIRTDVQPLMVFLLQTRSQLLSDIIIKGNASKVEFALESTSRGSPSYRYNIRPSGKCYKVLIVVIAAITLLLR